MSTRCTLVMDPNYSFGKFQTFTISPLEAKSFWKQKVYVVPVEVQFECPLCWKHTSIGAADIIGRCLLSALEAKERTLLSCFKHHKAHSFTFMEIR